MQYFDIHLVGVKNKSLVVSDKTKISFLKKKLSKNVEKVEIIYKGEFLEDECLISDYKIVEDSILYYHIINGLGYENKNRFANSNTINQLVNIIGGLINLPNDSLNDNIEYETELENLETMGFLDREQNRTLLNLYNGHLETVINVLLGV